MVSPPESQDGLIRRHVYELAFATGAPPTIADLSSATRLPGDTVRESLQRLAAGQVLVLQQHSGEILMAAPFSAVPTAFVVQTPRFNAFANCVWDALGIPAMLGQAAVIHTACGCCGEKMDVTVGENEPEPAAGIIHFAIPAARWWEDIVFT
jgi:hypothetical protein